MLVRRQQFSAVVSGVIAVVGLDETIVGQRVILAVLQELLVGAKDLRLVFSRLTTSCVELDGSK